jgi:hypothetical protein
LQLAQCNEIIAAAENKKKEKWRAYLENQNKSKTSYE